MDTIEEIRRRNLEALIRQAGSIATLAEEAESSAVYLSQIRHKAPDSKTGKPREMGKGMARRLERAMGKPEGWMDREHADDQSAEARAKLKQEIGVRPLADRLQNDSTGERHELAGKLRSFLLRTRRNMTPAEFMEYLDALDKLEGQPPPESDADKQH